MRLNNFVTTYLDLEAPKSGSYSFTLEDPGWVFIRTLDGSPGIQVTLQGEPTARLLSYTHRARGTREAMRHLASGTHTLLLQGSGLGRLQVRRIPEIRYSRFQYDPWVIPFGPYNWEYLQKYILPHVTTIVGTAGGPGVSRQSIANQKKMAQLWRGKGKRWIQEVVVPGLVPRKPVTAANVLDRFAGALRPPWIDGILIDEYSPALEDFFATTLAATENITADPRFSGKSLDFYVAGDPAMFAPFLQTSIRLGSSLTVELYESDQSTEIRAREYLQKELVDLMTAYQGTIPTAQEHMSAALGIMSGPPRSLSTRADVNYLVFLDMQFNLLANDPAFEGLAGIMGYTSGYAEDETLRWVGELFRHYCIEGKKNRLSNEPYLLTHVANPEFERGVAGWEIAPAEPGSIETREIPSLGEMEGRYGGGKTGDTCLVMRRSAKAPNVIRQRITQLVPGSLYALRLYSASLPKFDDKNTIAITVEGADVVPGKTFQHVYRSTHTEPVKKMYFNYHFCVFRARSESARLTLSDWEAPDRRHGDVGEETCMNFIKVQPYFAPSDDIDPLSTLTDTKTLSAEPRK